MSKPYSRFARRAGDGDVVYRWECDCQQPPVLLATYNGAGHVNIKMRDRYWHVVGEVRTSCPRCGAEHVLDLGPSAERSAEQSPRTASRR